MGRIGQISLGVVLIAVGVPGLVLPVIPGIAFIAGGLALILGPDHHWVRRGRAWLERKGLLKTDRPTGGK